MLSLTPSGERDKRFIQDEIIDFNNEEKRVAR